MAEPILTYEVKQLLDKIKNEIVQQFPIQVITLNYFMYAVIDSHTNDVKVWLEDNTMSSTIDELTTLITNKISTDCMSSMVQNQNAIRFSNDYDKLAESIAEISESPITSASMFLSIVNSDKDYTRWMLNNGLSIEAIRSGIDNIEQANSQAQAPDKKKKKSRKKQVVSNDEPTIKNGERLIPEENNVTEANTSNMVRNASNGDYSTIVGFDRIIDTIFDTFAKYERKCVAVVGERGVGKTALVERMAQRLYDQDCPKMFKNRYLMRFDDQITPVIMDDMDKSDKYIGFIDNLENMFANKEAEPMNVFVLKKLLQMKNTPVIVTMNDGAYAKHVESKPDLARLLHKITLEEPTTEEIHSIVDSSLSRYSTYHNVKYTEDAITASIKLAKRFITTDKAPRSVLNIIDAGGAYARLRATESDELKSLKENLKSILSEKSKIGNSGSEEDYNRKDQLTREELDIKNKIKELEKNEPEITVSVSDIKAVLSNILNLPISDINDDDKEKLKTLEDRLSAVVIGQNRTINDVCKAVKRQRVGLSNPNRPCSLFFGGSTGVGKSFLAKRLAYELFGSEDNMVRLDMSEYSEKTSVTKLYGSSSGYIGYEEGGILTEAIKKKNRCVLLLDEIEKAHDDVFNVFLQVFDEGRLTDNKGTTVNFKDVIIIMTSNVGATDVSNKQATIGFSKQDENEEDREIITKALKKKFKPEFINRIDNICYFNKLTDDDLRRIIVNEVEKVHKKVIDIGYDLDETILHGKLIDSIFEKVKEESEYGARPIIREIQSQLEDKLTDYIIDNNVENGFVFSYDTIYK